MKTTLYKGIEFLVIFVIVPVSFAINYSYWVKLVIGFVGFIYVIYVLLKIENQKLKLATNLNWKLFWKTTLFKFFAIVFITTLFVIFTEKESLFKPILNQPKLWLIILFVYSVFSVYPQELIFRTFYFKRYKVLIKNRSYLIFLNAIVFSLAHLFFANILVSVLTFIGGLLFATTYKKTQSTIMVSVEHAIYGCWLYTVGMGGMLGFPT